jgi:hypothetical protein
MLKGESLSRLGVQHAVKEQDTDYTTGLVATAVLPKPLMEQQSTPPEERITSI